MAKSRESIIEEVQAGLDYIMDGTREVGRLLSRLKTSEEEEIIGLVAQMEEAAQELEQIINSLL